jgi:hypothetical protein
MEKSYLLFDFKWRNWRHIFHSILRCMRVAFLLWHFHLCKLLISLWICMWCCVVSWIPVNIVEEFVSPMLWVEGWIEEQILLPWRRRMLVGRSCEMLVLMYWNTSHHNPEGNNLCAWWNVLGCRYVAYKAHNWFWRYIKYGGHVTHKIRF